MCIRIFIGQTMKLIALYKQNQKIWICDILSLNLRPRNTSEKLRHTCTWVVFKGYLSRLLVRHCVGFKECCIWKTRRWLWRLRFFKICCCFYILQKFPMPLCSDPSTSCFDFQVYWNQIACRGLSMHTQLIINSS